MSLENAIRTSWGSDTTSDAQRWSAQNPAWGQCAVTACVLNDYLGGEIVWAQAQLPDGESISHYFNKLPSGEIRDLTREQFPQGTVVPEGVPKTKQFATTRDYVLSFAVTRQRYETLRDRVGHSLQAP